MQARKSLDRKGIIWSLDSGLSWLKSCEKINYYYPRHHCMEYVDSLHERDKSRKAFKSQPLPALPYDRILVKMATLLLLP